MTRDARSARLNARERFLKVRRAGVAFERQLRSVARQIGLIVDGFAPEGEVQDSPGLMQALEKYAQLLRPWAKNVTAQLLARLNLRDEKAWVEMTKELGVSLRKEIRGARTGAVVRGMMDEQVDLITSLPTKAAQRVHKLTIEGLSDGTRAAEIAKQIMKTGEVTESRAMLIARTEVARTASALNMARAQALGCKGYIWRTAGDSDVRDDHKKLEGKFIEWDNPPIADSKAGVRAHAGMIYRCRCFMEPVLPDDLK